MSNLKGHEKYAECIHCNKFFDCKHKGEVVPCINFEERKEENGRCKVDKDIN